MNDFAPPHTHSSQEDLVQKLLGKFIVLEGIDGAGKNEILNAVEHALITLFPTLKDRFIATAEPTEESEPSKEIETFLTNSKNASLSVEESKFLATLYIADRKIHGGHLRTWQEQGKIILSTRYDLSTYAYQGASFPAHEHKRQEFFEELYVQHAYNQSGGCVLPSLTFFLEIPRTVSAERIKKRNKTLHFFEKQQADFSESVVSAYREAIAFLQQKDDRILLTLDGTASIEVICSQILKTLLKD